jgi:hypothetical protein
MYLFVKKLGIYVHQILPICQAFIHAGNSAQAQPALVTKQLPIEDYYSVFCKIYFL